MCVTVQKKYVPGILLRAYRAAGLRVNMLEGNKEMGIKEMAIMTSGINTINI
jgi:hypothetical protein